jgi:hypothetical protein
MVITGKVRLSLHGKYVRVYIKNGFLLKVCLPGDLMEITDQMNLKDLESLESRAIFQLSLGERKK